MHCPTLNEVTSSILALLPRGRAWQTNEGAPRAGSEIAFNPNAFNNNAFQTLNEEASVLYQYWRSFAVVMHYLNERLCALREEFWCQSVNETRPEWMTEYGLPDECDPFPDLCTKVAAIGGTRCEYYQSIVARMGWSIACSEAVVSCGSRVGFQYAGHARTGGTLGLALLKITVFLNESPAFVGGRALAARSGRLRSGRRLSCGPDLTPLRCLLGRIVHAEIQTVYEVNNGS